MMHIPSELSELLVFEHTGLNVGESPCRLFSFLVDGDYELQRLWTNPWLRPVLGISLRKLESLGSVRGGKYELLLPIEESTDLSYREQQLLFRDGTRAAPISLLIAAYGLLTFKLGFQAARLPTVRGDHGSYIVFSNGLQVQLDEYPTHFRNPCIGMAGVRQVT